MGSIIVYDTQNYFYRYVKYTFKEHFVSKVTIIDLSKYKKIKRANLIFVVVYDEFDFLSFMFFYKFNKNLVVCSADKTILARYQKMHDLLCFDISKPKSDFLEEFKEKIKISF
jgi:hypothetical protein